VREAYQKWVHQMWLDKDAQIAALIKAAAPVAVAQPAIK